MSTTISSPMSTETAMNLPSQSTMFSALLRSDLTAQWRNRRSSILVLLVPTVILMSWKGVAEKFGGAFALSSCVTIGLMSIGLMGYTNTTARDRDKGIFQRLRVTPAPTWAIMGSRLTVQLLMILLMTLLLFFVGFKVDNIVIPFKGYGLGLFAAIIGGAVYLSLGQVIVGLIKSPETVNVVTRLVYFVFMMVGMFADLGVLGKQIGEIAKWSPYGCVKRMVLAGLSPETWTTDTSMFLLATIGYTAIFAFLGIRWFRWSNR